MISVSQALEQLFALVSPTDVEEVPLLEAVGRVLAKSAIATRNQPPFASSAMDGYAVQAGDARPGAVLQVIGEAAAGHHFEGQVTAGQAVRIFTGAVVPEGADYVVIQEDVRREDTQIILNPSLDQKAYVRPLGSDFRTGDALDAPRRLTASDVALLASMNLPKVWVHRAPKVALISTGDELVMPGEAPRPDQIIASNTFGLHAMLRGLGAAPRLLPIARDTEASLQLAFELAADADLVVTIGGASVGDHDIVAKVMAQGERHFYKVAMRPGKPLMAGRLGDAMMVGLPGNPVSAMVCGHVFLAPVIRAMQGLPSAAAPRLLAPLGVALPEGGPREHYMRACLTPSGLTPFERQDSALLTVLADADALLVRPPHDAPRAAGELVEYLPL